MQRVLASWFGTGLILGRLRGSDAGSGTMGAVFTFILWLVLRRFGWGVELGAALLVAALCVWAARPFAADHGDPGWVVIDEAAGALLSMVGLGIPAAIVAWVVFRIADIFKRTFPGVSQAEALPGSFGIAADDLVAGLYGLAAGWIVQMLM